MNHYEAAINVITSDYDWKALCVEIAKKKPAIIVKAAKAISLDWKKGAREYLADGQKIQAIKHCRNITGWSLVEAKNAVDALV